jgi:hypothetical protein
MVTDLFIENNIIIVVAIASVSIIFVTITYSYVRSLGGIENISIERPIDYSRVYEGLPTDVTITQEDFTNHPELAEILGVTDTTTNVEILLESNEHFMLLETIHSTFNIVVDFFSPFI